jgi:hypothetical protein
MPIPCEIHPVPVDRNAFGPEPQLLLEAIFTSEANPALRAQHAMPGDGLASGSQSPDYLSRGPRISARRGNIAVRRNPAFRNSPDHGQYTLEHYLVRNFSSIST